MSVNFEYYKVFYYVAKYKKISLAAEKLFVTQPAVTQTIQKLEQQLGSNLFMRSKEGIELTETGKMLYDFTGKIIEELEKTEYRFGKYENLEEGIIKIRTGNTIAKVLLYDAVEKFGKEYPNIRIEICTGAPNESAKLLNKGKIDMMLVYLPYKLEYNNLQVTECANKQYIFAMSEKYRKKNKVKLLKLEDLNKYSLIVPKKHSAIRNLFDEKFKDIITDFHYEVAQENMKKEFIMRDMGIGFILKDEIEDELKNGEIVRIDLENSVIDCSIGAITLNRKLSTFATKKLLEFIRKVASPHVQVASQPHESKKLNLVAPEKSSIFPTQ